MTGFYNLFPGKADAQGANILFNDPPGAGSSAEASGRRSKRSLTNSILMAVLLLFGTLGVKAAGLSGTYTIDPAGSGSTNYTTFTLAVSALTTNGVSGPVVFNVAAATFSAAPSITSAISGASATNTITFRGQGRGKTIVSVTSTAVSMTNASYITFDQITFKTSGTTYFCNASYTNYCSIRNCEIIGTSVASGSYGVYAYYSNNLTIFNSYISGGYYGLYMYGTSSSAAYGYLTLQNSRVVNYGYMGLYDYYAYGDNYQNNVVDSSNGASYGMYTYYTNAITINANKFLGTASSASLYNNYYNYYPVSGKPAVSAVVTNNFITGGSTYCDQEYVPYMTTSAGGWVYAHNTIVNTTATSYALYIYAYSSSAGTGVLANNIIYNTASASYIIYNYAYSPTFYSLCDGNCFYSSYASASYIIYDGSTSYSSTSFASYQTQMKTYGWDKNSVNSQTTFVKTIAKPYDFHLSTTVAGPKGVWAGIATDIDGDGRFKTPSAGADESYYGAANDNAGVFALIQPKNFCPGSANIAVDVANLGLNDISNVMIGWSVDGSVQTPVKYTTTISKFGDAVVTLGSYTFAAGVQHKIKAWTYLPNGNTDTKASDDTLLVSNVAPSLSGTFTINSSAPASSTNFTTFASAASYLTASGVCGPVTFKVSNGTYNELVNLSGVSGVSATNTITFDGGDSSKTILSYPTAGSGQAVFNINGTNYVTLKRMSVITGSNSGAFGIHITGGSSYCTISGCIVKADTNTSNSVTPLGICGSTYTSSDAAHDNTVINNIIKGGYYAMTVYGASSSAPSANNYLIRNKVSRAYYTACYMYYQINYKVLNNSFAVTPNSATSSYGTFFYYSNRGTIDGNTFQGNYIGVYLYYDNIYVTGGTTNFTNNVIYGQYYTSGSYTLYLYSYSANIYHNIFYNTSPATSSYYTIYTAGGNTNAYDIRDNIFYKASTGIYFVYCSSTSYMKNFDNNDFWGAGGLFIYNGSAYGDLPTYQKAFASTAAVANNNSVTTDPGFTSTVYGSENFRMCKSCYGITGAYVGVDKDFDGNSRCKLFPNVGAFETNNGKGKPNVKFFITSNIYPNSPSYVYQTYKAGSPTKSTWYLQNSNYGSLTKISDSTVLFTNKFTTGSNTLKLVVQTCGGNDSFTQTFNISAPTAVPGTDFVANKNSILVNDIVSFQDLTTNGPTTWTWKVSPDSTISGGAKVAAVKYTFGSSKWQNPQIQFMFAGKYQVCLTTTNSVGKGANVCKKDYITVLPAVNIGTSIVTNAQGYLYDDGGPSSAYVNNGGTPSTVISPCADSVYLVFTMFDVNCNVGFVQLYEGTNAKGKRLDPCGGSGLNSGFTGGPSGSVCSTPCMPNVTKPDTFKAAKAMFIQMNDGSTSANAKGFAAYWWSKPSSSKKPTASFKVNGTTGDSVCVNANVNFVNTTPNTNPNDPVSVLWDLDGDNTTFECIGTCANAYWPYFLAGPVTLTMIATNCGGSDTFTKTITVYNPKSPKTAILADNTNPTTGDVVFLTAPIAQCVDDYKWTITKSAGSGTGTAYYVNNTSNLSAAPQVTFSDTGYYDIKLFVDNLGGLQKDSLTVKKYVHVRNPYCIPSVATLNQGMGISKVTLNTLNNVTAQAQQEYTNFASNQSVTTSLAQGATYPITISRNSSLLFENLNRSVFIDWNQDGSFTGKGEEAAEDSNSNSVTWTGKITVPKTAKLGATIMRIAVNRGAYSNKPCGQNEFGEYQDYRIYITPYNIPPVITLTGTQGLKDTIKIEQGHNYVEAGYSANSFLYGDMTKFVKVASRKQYSINPADSFNSVIPATYIFTYNVTDSAGNKAATQYRIVVVYKDKTPPVLIVDKPDTTVMEVTSTPLTPFPAPKVISADDLVDGPLAAAVVNDANKVTSNIVGFYTITYTVTDLTGNSSTVYRYVKIIDTIKPVLKLIGSNPVDLQVYNSYADAGVSATDNYYSAAILNSLVTVINNVDTAKLGTYTFTYNLTDPSGNIAKSVTRTVNVIDTIAPVISLIGPSVDSISVFSKYADPGVSVVDNYNKTNVTVKVTGTYYSNFPAGSKASKTGVYTIIYTATDASGNSASVTRTVKVQDREAPVFTLIGSNTVTVCRWFPYVDAGYTVTDNYDAASSIKVDTLVSGNTLTDGLFNIQYRGTDKSGNVGYSEYRYILVRRAGDPGCVSGIETGLGLEKYISVYPNPNSGMFTISAKLPVEQKVRISVTNMLGQEIAVIHNGILGQNNFQVDLSNQVGGIYLLNITTDTQTVTKRIEIVR